MTASSDGAPPAAPDPRGRPGPSPSGNTSPEEALFGKTLVREGILTPEQVQGAIRSQAEMRSSGVAMRLGEVLVKQGHLTPEQVRHVLQLVGVVLLHCAKCGRNYNVRNWSPGRDVFCPTCSVELGPPLAKTLDAHSTQHLHSATVIADRRDVRGTPFGRYRLLEKLGQGGMGIVWKAWDTQLKRVVALKQILAESASDAGRLERFLREARASARLRHPHIVAVHDVGEFQGQHYFTADCIAGQPLDSLLKKPMSVQKATSIVKQVAEALQYAHEQGIVHRDVKPANILVDGKGHPYITDFGLAKDVEGSTREGLTLSGALVGTPRYMSPEQASGQSERMGPPADQFSLGVVLYELLTGRPAFDGQSLRELLNAVSDQDPVPPTKVNPRLHRDIETICLKAIEKDPTRRYATIGDFAEDLDRYMNGLIPIAQAPSTVDRIVRRARRQWRPLGACLAVLLAAGSVWIFTRREVEEQQSSVRKQTLAEFLAAAQTREAQHDYEQAVKLLDGARVVGTADWTPTLDAEIARLRAAGAAWAWDEIFSKAEALEKAGEVVPAYLAFRECEAKPPDAARQERIAASLGQCLKAHFGTELWSYVPRADRVSQGFELTVCAGRVFAAWSRRLCALDLRTGKELWTSELPIEYKSMGTVMAASPERVHVSYETGLMTFDAATGKLLWKTEKSALIATPVLGRGVIVVPLYEQKVRAYAADTGEVKWTIETQGNASVLAVVENDLLVGDSAETLHVLDLETGAQRQNVVLPGPPRALALDGAHVCVSMAGGMVLGFDRSTWRKIWEFENDSTVDVAALPGRVLLWGRQVIQMLDAGMGTSLWKSDLHAGLYSPEAIPVGNRIYISSTWGLQILDAGSGQPQAQKEAVGESALNRYREIRVEGGLLIGIPLSQQATQVVALSAGDLSAGGWTHANGRASGISMNEHESLAACVPAANSTPEEEVTASADHWERVVVNGTASDPVIFGDCIVFADLLGGLSALRAKTGESAWITDLKMTVPVHLVAIGRRLIAVTQAGTVYALEGNPPRLLWKQTCGEGMTVTHPPSGRADTVIVVADGAPFGRIIAFSITDGKTLWQADQHVASSSAVIDQDFVLVPQLSGDIPVFEFQTGRCLFQITAGLAAPTFLLHRELEVAVGSDTVRGLAGRRWVRWQATFEGGVGPSLLARHDAFLVAGEKSLVALDALGGDERGRVDLGAPIQSLAATQGIVWALVDSREVVGVQAETLKVIHRVPVSEMSAGPLLIGGGWAFLTTGRGRITGWRLPEAQADGWSQSGGASTRAGLNPEYPPKPDRERMRSRYQDFKPIWRVEIPGWFGCPPTIANGKVWITGGHACRVYSYDLATGKKENEIDPVAYLSYASPLVLKNSVIVSDGRGKTYAFDSVTGKQAWVTETRKEDTGYGNTLDPMASASRDDSKLYLTDMYGSVDCLSAANGRRIWHFGDPGDAFIWAPASVGPDWVYVHGIDGWMTALDPNTGKVKWRTETETGGMWSAPVVSDGKVISFTQYGIVHCWDAKTGRELWKWKAEDDWFGCTMAADGDRLYVGGCYVVYSLNLKTGELLWTAPHNFIMWGGPIPGNDCVMVADYAGDLLCYNKSTGDLRWARSLTDTGYSEGFSVDDGKAVAVVGTGSMAKGQIYELVCIDVPEFKGIRWPMVCGNPQRTGTAPKK
ncbi:MAG: PQQ-binding-like beta-propeller repeat protein [Planctomycetes bacterium]|nr:PQQ-binding-like beta-propeller repeat protein [Planctomycetota bacterium]